MQIARQITSSAKSVELYERLKLPIHEPIMHWRCLTGLCFHPDRRLC